MKQYPWIRRWVKEAGTKQYKLAAAMKIDGSKLTHTIDGGRGMTADELAACAKFLKCSMEEIYTGNRNKPGPVGEGQYFEYDEILIQECATKIFSVSESMKTRIDPDKVAACVVELYNLAMEAKNKGEDFTPNNTIASLILRKAV